MLPESDAVRAASNDKKFTICRCLGRAYGAFKWLSDKMSPNGDFIGGHPRRADATKLKKCWKSG